MSMKGRTWQSEKYRYGFNGQEKDTDINQEGNHTTAEFWEYSSVIGRRWNIDPIERVGESLYAVNLNNPIGFSDRNGDAPNEDKPVPVKPPSDDKPVPTKPPGGSIIERANGWIGKVFTYIANNYKAEAKAEFGLRTPIEVPTTYGTFGGYINILSIEAASVTLEKKSGNILPEKPVINRLGKIDDKGRTLTKFTHGAKVGYKLPLDTETYVSVSEKVEAQFAEKDKKRQLTEIKAKIAIKIWNFEREVEWKMGESNNWAFSFPKISENIGKSAEKQLPGVGLEAKIKISAGESQKKPDLLDPFK